MQWYVCLVTIPAVFFVGQVIVELIGRQTQAILRLRNRALERLLVFRNLQLPGPRELAVSSREIREYDQAAQNVRQAERTFAELGAQLLAFGESEPTIRALMALCGLDIVLAGHELIYLSELYGAAKCDSDAFRRAIEGACQAAMKGLAASRQLSGNGLIQIRLEPMRLRDVARTRKRLLRQRYATARHAQPGVGSAANPATRFAR